MEHVMEHGASFGMWLTLRRQSLRLQRTELAKRIGCAAVTLRKIEADERRPSRQIAALLAEQLAIPPEERETFIRVARGELQVDRLPAPNPEARGAGNLPLPATSLAGRERETAEIAGLLARPEVRLLTLTGAPGVGKSRLAVEAAARLHGAFADGVFHVALASLSDPHLLLPTIAQALRLGSSGRQALSERLGRYLRARQLLLVLDTFEHLLAAAPQLSGLLAAAPRLKLLVTSRVALELTGEQRFTVEPLPVPAAADGRRQPLAAAEAQRRYASIELFVRRARAVAPGFALSDENVAAVGAICRRVDGLPLAIELAAARAALFTPEELLAQLEDRFALLTSRARDLPERHMSLWQAIDWSYSLLAPAEQLLFRRLAVFVGGSSLEAAQAVCNVDRAIEKIVDGVAALSAGSLIQRYGGYDGRSRFGMLETVREYALAQLRASGEAETLLQRHGAYYLALAQSAERAWDQDEEWPWLRRLVSVRDNLRAALRRSIEAGDRATALQLNAALFTFWITGSALSEARGWIEATLALPRGPETPELVAAEAKVLNVAGYVLAGLAEHERAAAAFERGLGLYRAIDNTRGVAWSIRGRAFVHMLRDEHGAARELLSESLRLCRASGDSWGLAWSLYALAFLWLAEGEQARARPALEEALAHLRQQEMSFGALRTLLALAHMAFEQGDVAGAEARYREGLSLLQGAPLLTLLTNGLEGMAMVAAAQGRPARAARLFGAAEALRDLTDERRWHVFQRSYERALAAAQGQLPAAEWAAEWAAGRALPSEQALAEALEGGPSRGQGELVLLEGGNIHSLAGVS
jgi:predicted ATPase/DNA-binding XRE family transcriptional regulator